LKTGRSWGDANRWISIVGILQQFVEKGAHSIVACASQLLRIGDIVDAEDLESRRQLAQVEGNSALTHRTVHRHRRLQKMTEAGGILKTQANEILERKLDGQLAGV
jgi:hypothetical protein